MIVTNKEDAYLSFYIMDKEFFQPKHIRRALNIVSFLIYNKKKDRSLAIDIAYSKVKREYDLNNSEFSIEDLWTAFRQRQAFVRHGKKAYEQYAIDKRTNSIPDAEKTDMHLCECNCGGYAKSGNRFINGHNTRIRKQN